MLTANRFPGDRDGTGRRLPSAFTITKTRSHKPELVSTARYLTGRWELHGEDGLESWSFLRRLGSKGTFLRAGAAGVGPPTRANKALWADRRGRCGVCRVNHVEREHFSLSADQEDTTQKDPRPGEGRILGAPLCSGFIVRVQSECRS